MKRYIKNPFAERTERIRQNGCTIRVTRGDTIVEERIVTPEEIAMSNQRRDAILDSKRVPN